MGADGLIEAGGERRVIAAGLPSLGLVDRGAVAGRWRSPPGGGGPRRAGPGLGDGLAGILGVEPLRLRAEDGLGRRDEAGGREGADVLAGPAGPFVIRAGATGGLALGGGDDVAGDVAGGSACGADQAARIPASGGRG